MNSFCARLWSKLAEHCGSTESKASASSDTSDSEFCAKVSTSDPIAKQSRETSLAFAVRVNAPLSF